MRSRSSQKTFGPGGPRSKTEDRNITILKNFGGFFFFIKVQFLLTNQSLTHIKFNFEIPDIILYFSKKILAKNCSLQNVRIEKKCMYVHMFPKHHR